MITYMLWDMNSRNLLLASDKEEKIKEFIESVHEQHGEHVTDDWDLLRVDISGDAYQSITSVPFK